MDTESDYTTWTHVDTHTSLTRVRFPEKDATLVFDLIFPKAASPCFACGHHRCIPKQIYCNAPADVKQSHKNLEESTINSYRKASKASKLYSIAETSSQPRLTDGAARKRTGKRRKRAQPPTVVAVNIVILLYHVQ